MNGRTQGGRARWIRVGFAASVLIAAHALHGGSADAATVAAQPHVAPAPIRATAVPIHATAVPVLAARDASAAPGIVLAGFTSQHYPAFFKVSGNGRTLTLGAISLDMNCTSGAEFVLPDAFAKLRIKRNGRLQEAVSIPPTAGSNGDTYSGSDSLTAHLNRRHSQLSGTWRLQLNYSFTNGMSDACDSGPVRFVATP